MFFAKPLTFQGLFYILKQMYFVSATANIGNFVKIKENRYAQ